MSKKIIPRSYWETLDKIWEVENARKSPEIKVWTCACHIIEVSKYVLEYSDPKFIILQREDRVCIADE